ncbi:hypothetical protein [Candidatus Tisiphia endosymbiont of Parasteatoda lunata]|uniref:hypothetical protein n=1 Tax=Candidatus Tisiphia endosymbiont of Parasteatoda lunata TaxID=3066275 RepID=UPI00313B83E3
MVKNRTALANEIRGLLYEFGFTIPQGINKIITKLTEILDEGDLSQLSYQTFSELKEEFVENDKKIKDRSFALSKKYVNLARKSFS